MQAATCVRNALVFISRKGGKDAADAKEDADWWNRWAAHDASTQLLKLIKAVLRAAPAALQVGSPGVSAFMLRQILHPKT